MIRLPGGCEPFLQDILPHGWRAASQNTHDLTRRLEFLAWPDRVRVIDDFVWMRARAMLTNDEITGIINRETKRITRSYSLLEYTTYCRAIITGILLVLREPPTITERSQALVYLLSSDETHEALAREWIGPATGDVLRPELACLPGFSFLFLTVHANDSVESFMARDAFWQAMLGG